MNGLFRRGLIGLCIACCFLLAGCCTEKSVSFETIEQASVGSSDISGGIYLLRSETEWSAFWNRLKASYLPVPPLPSVNFDENVVIVVIGAVYNTGGHSVTITGIDASQTGVTVQAVHQSPGESCGTTSAFEQPYHIIATPVFSGEATLDLTETVDDCNAQ